MKERYNLRVIGKGILKWSPLIILTLTTLVLIASTQGAPQSTVVTIGHFVSAPGEMITAPLLLADITNYGTGTITVRYDPSVFQVAGVASGPQSTVIASNTNNTIGFVTISAWNMAGASGDIIFANVTFKAVGTPGSSTPLNLTIITLKDTSYATIPATVSNGSFSIESKGEEIPDLVPLEITINCGYLIANKSNNITATIKNNGTAAAGTFNVSFNVNGFSAKASVGGLDVGNDTEVSITDPTLRYAGATVNITVTADCDSAIAESNETNNNLTLAEVPVKTNETLDNKPPLITNVTTIGITANSATIAWDTDELSDSRVKYGTISGSYGLTVYNQTNVTTHTIVLSGLSASTTYYYIVSSTDLSGNSNESAEYTLTTLSASTPTPVPPRGGGGGGGGGGGTLPDSDNDGIPDLLERSVGSDPTDPCDPNPQSAFCLARNPPTPTPTPTLVATPTPIVIPTPAKTPRVIITPPPTPLPFPVVPLVVILGVISAAIIGGVAYMLRRR